VRSELSTYITARAKLMQTISLAMEVPFRATLLQSTAPTTSKIETCAMALLSSESQRLVKLLGLHAHVASRARMFCWEG
jgi:hypothetical protein